MTTDYDTMTHDELVRKLERAQLQLEYIAEQLTDEVTWGRGSQRLVDLADSAGITAKQLRFREGGHGHS